MRNHRQAGGWVALAVLVVSAASIEARELSLDARLSAQRAIEEVYWRHRLWPETNPGPKPPFESAASESMLRARVNDYLAKSSAIERIRARAISAEELQAEIDRMIAESLAPETLKELFGALGDDPFLIAECLARPIVVDRLLRERSGPDFEPWWELERRRPAAPVRAAQGSYAATATFSTCTANTWTPTSTGVNVPASRFYHTAVWTGAEMIVWGGYAFFPLDTGGRYVPATNTWTPTSLGANVPTGRYRHSAIWTGTRMIVWGGIDGGGLAQSGARYDPVADTWASTSTGANVPSARSEHSAVWTGTRMIVWGGGDGTSSYVATGARYDPGTNSWSPTSTGANVPAGRRAHRAVWTGTGNEMIVWGGTGAGAVDLSSGARYAPGSDTWSPISAVGAPGPFNFGNGQAAVWTGIEMIVWQTTGGRYDPVGDTWIATGAGANVPSSRFDHVAIWTGCEMIVWGGIYGTNRTGGRYNPSNDTWVATSVTGAPVERYWHTAVWTGSEMIVWGGRDENTGNALSTGARFCKGDDGTFYADLDGDGYGNPATGIATQSCLPPEGYVADGSDCNDANGSIHPGASDNSCDGIDQNCSGSADEGFPTQSTHCGVGACASDGMIVCVGGEIQNTCVPGDPSPELCDGSDNDCNGSVDDAEAPSAIPLLGLGKPSAGTGRLFWSAIFTATAYDVVRGGISNLRLSNGNFAVATQTCLVNDFVPGVLDDTDPAIYNAGFWYLVRPVNCGGAGTYESGSASQVGARDGEIATSGAACP